MTLQAPPPPAQRPGRDTTSIRGFLRQNPRERLYVPPIGWTARQPRLLGCHFTPDKIHVETGDPPSTSRVRTLRDQQPYQHPILAIARLLSPGTLAAKKLDVADLLRPYHLASLGAESLSFYFAHQKAASISTDGLFAHPGTGPNLAYLTSDTIHSLRTKNVCRWRGGKPNEPVRKIHQKQLRSLEPRNPVEDPYIIAVLIALAQAQRHQTAEALQTTPRSFHVIVLAITGRLAEGLYVYTATVSTAFLDRLDAPSQPLSSAPIPVKYFRISLIPGRKALRKLHHLLCTGTCTLCAGEEHGRSGRVG